MGKRINPREKITQRSTGFHFRQIEFFNEYPEFKPDYYCRKIIDEQIALIDPKFLSEDDEKIREKRD